VEQDLTKYLYNIVSQKDFEKESFPFPKGEEKALTPVKKDNSHDGELNNPNVPMRRKNKICNDGKDWFDTHPDA